MENSHTLSSKLILGGALLSVLLVPVLAFGYSQNTTHPALTDEIVDFYNLNFPNDKITEEEKQRLIQGSIDEDDGLRMLYHFYDPVYDRGLAIVAGASSKDWGLATNFQANVLGKQYAGFTSVFNNSSKADFSYGRALEDYAKGDRERAFIAFGHILHLLEDAGVPDHTRDDPHPPVLDLGSPYEHEMAKWSLQNFQIARTLFLRREKPVLLSSIENYFDRVANYSNNNFFSKDTINNEVYSKPVLNNLKNLYFNGSTRLFVVNKDKNGLDFPIALAVTDSTNKNIKSITLYNEIVNSYILDGYWDRLSKEVVIGGAGALKLFLEEAEKAKKEYLVKQEQKKPSFWAQVASLFGFDGGDNDGLATPNQIPLSGDGTGQASGVNDGLTTGELATSEGRGTSDVNGDSGDKTSDTSSDRNMSPTVSPLSPSLSPKPIVSPLVLPSPTPKLTTSDGQRTSDVKTTGKVVINEIAWAGTEASPNDEWLELYNTENYDINLSGWALKAEDGTPDITVEEGKIIKAQSYFLFERTNDTTVNSVAADQIYTGALGNDGEFVRLIDAAGIVVNTAGNSGSAWPAGSSTGKISMERTASGWKNFTGSPSAKDANGNFINGTPGTANSTTVVTFSSGGGGGGSSSSPTPTPTPSPSPTPSPEPEGDSEDGDTANSGDVVINEIAWMGTFENSLCEWVELRNMTDNEVNLVGWKLYEQDGSVEIISLTQKITPNGYYLIKRETPTCPDPVPSVEADDSGSFGGSGLNNTSGEKLTLKDAVGTVIDEVDGSNGWKLNGDDEIIGDNTTKKTAQRMDSGWITATATPKTQNSADAMAQAPSAVTNLATIHGSPTITATWTAPDPGIYNTASLSYDLRYSSTIFTEVASASWWSAATVVASSSLPSVAEVGAQQSASFDVVPEYGLMLYFALRTKVINLTTCEVVNEETVDKCSEISNVATVSFDSAIDDGAWGMFGKDQYHTSLATVAGPGIDATVSWEFDAAVEFESGYNVSQPVADADGNIYFGVANGSSGKIAKLDKNGVQQWDEPYETNVSIGTPAVLSDGTVYFGRVGAGGFLAFTALNPDGSNKWNYSDASTIQSFTVSPKGEPHFTYTSGMDKLGVLNTDGSIKTSFPISASGLAGFAPVVLDDGTIIVAKRISGNQFFNAYSVDGSQLWPAELFYTGANGNVPSDPSYDKSTGKTYSAAGSKLFNIPFGGSTINVDNIAQRDYFAATMVAVTSDTLYVGFNNTNPASGSLLYALNKSDLTTKWLFQADGLLNKQLAVDKDGNVYLSTQNGKLYSIDSTGNQRWVINSSQNSRISPILTEHGLIWGYGSKIVLISD
ncbi:MAG: hypothetical protein A3J47_03870 [Candidatus Yanofskybacteria bacterium RIFCSPHIGHO2_02_FULL_43_22]|uniref:LTD domain-containing protein n=1 Tax=Candidatus Yanofskybacteria bacterium RIFCSPHIGHO2_02_FULL_43_22 TaxID=1802681 RepID=A0A1F8FJW6_9BACT|nr:MAG: hypothetical protein A3J47_03870 [Candidatus Yanofskybacteria bacterium RIFCSPHIGHO2_02_FULL_43_22]